MMNIMNKANYNNYLMKKLIVAAVALLAWSVQTIADTTYTRYSQWLTYSEMKRVSKPYWLDFTQQTESKAKWSYVMGIELESMLDTYLTYGGDDIIAYLKEYPARMIAADGTITGYKLSDYNLDNVRTGRFIYRMYNLFPSKKDSLACQTLMKQLDNQPRTQAGPWHHKAIYANQVWLDGIYMGLPFYTLSCPKLRKGKEAQYYADAIQQMIATDEKTYDAKTDLWKHAWDEKMSIFWANPETGQSQHTWGRALGWYCMALIEVLDAMPQNTPDRDKVVALLQKVMTSVVKYQDAKSDVWYDVLDVSDPRNYLEATCSAMFTYTLLKGSRLGYLSASFREAGIRAYNGMVREFVKDNGDGTMSLEKCVSVSGLGPESNPKRDGSFSYYMSESVRANDAKGVGPFIWASLEMERMGYTIQNPTTNVSMLNCSTSATDALYELGGRTTSLERKGIAISKNRKYLVR